LIPTRLRPNELAPGPTTVNLYVTGIVTVTFCGMMKSYGEELDAPAGITYDTEGLKLCNNVDVARFLKRITDRVDVENAPYEPRIGKPSLIGPLTAFTFTLKVTVYKTVDVGDPPPEMTDETMTGTAAFVTIGYGAVCALTTPAE